MSAMGDRHRIGAVLGHTVLGGKPVVGDVDDQAPMRLVSMHEALHAALNATTPFGAILTAYHLLAQDIDLYRPVMPKLIAMCDAVHEEYATYLSVQITGIDISAVPEAFRYRDIYRRADLLVPNGLPAKTAMVEAGLRACMSPMALSRLAEHILSPDTPDLFRDEDQPNTRLLMLETAGEAFWEYAWSQTADTVHEHPGWHEWQTATAGGDRPRGEAAEAVENQIAELLFAEVAAWFDLQGMPVQPLADFAGFANRIGTAPQLRPYRSRLRLPQDDAAVFPGLARNAARQYTATPSSDEFSTVAESAPGVEADAAVIARQLGELRSLVAREGQADVRQALMNVLGTLGTVAASSVVAAQEIS
ncbi:hypothetical protein ACFYP7_31330 [Micromonospora arida]|uniref:hypothetical protein n=1 Tax=Micromonospora arida TaxID=2203715 RepID=UPI0036859C53